MELAMKLLEKDIHEKQVSTHFYSVICLTTNLCTNELTGLKGT